MDTAGGAQPALVADTWEDVERLMYAEEPVNFILQGKPASSLQWDSCPTAACVVDALTIRMDAGTILFNQLLTPHWVQSPEESVAFSINISHGGLHRQDTGKGLCTNEAELEALKLADPEFAAIVDVKRGWKKTQQGDKK